MPTRSARTAWDGGFEDGTGQVELTSSGVGTYDVSFPKRAADDADGTTCLLYTSPSPRDATLSRMPSSA